MTRAQRLSRETRGDGYLTNSVICYRKAQLTSLNVGGLEVGMSGLGDILDKALEVMDNPDDDIKKILLAELKARNYIPSAAQEEYLKALWIEFRKARVRRREQLEMSYKGIPRAEIPWFPRVDETRCSGCSSCVEFCSKKVFSFDGKSHVISPYNCVVGNSSCRGFCPEKAISFPTTAELKESLAILREKHRVKS